MTARNTHHGRSRAAAQAALGGTQSIERSLALLREIAAHNRAGARLLDLAAAVDLRRPTVHRILKCLVRERLVMQEADNHRYFLGPMAFELGLTAAPRFHLREICQPALVRIAEKTGDTVFLTQRSGLDAVCLERHEGTFPIKTFTLEVGMRRPLGIGAGSLAMLSALPEEEIGRIVATNAPRIAEHGGLSVAAVMAQVRRAQKLGYAMRDVPGLAGVRTLGYAIRNSSGVPFAALSLSAISTRMNEKRVQELAALLKSEARLLEKQLSSGGEGTRGNASR
ncbi:MAG: IclR family transcriptional regulator [Betaproteobacteria bacterium]|nr:IclR family transcriptional regulator [Betaproteobacteria bacterium]